MVHMPVSGDPSAESFDAVLAEVRNSVWVDPGDLDRLAAAHEAEVAELRSEADRRTREVELTYLVQKRLTNRADRAAGLLRFLRSRFEKHMDDSDKAAIDAFLAQQGNG